MRALRGLSLGGPRHWPGLPIPLQHLCLQSILKMFRKIPEIESIKHQKALRAQSILLFKKYTYLERVVGT